MLEIAGLAIAGVTALGTIVQAYNTAKERKKKISNASLKQAEIRAGVPLRTGVKKVAEIIDPKLLKVLQQEIEKYNIELIEVFRSDEFSDSTKSKMVEEARLKICKFLKEVKSFNEGVLPTKRLEKLWLSNRCGKNVN